MSDEICACGESEDEWAADEPTSPDRWIDQQPATTGSLPRDMARLVSRFYSADSVETLGDFVWATRNEAGGAVGIEDLCHVDGESPHVATTSGETYHFRCFYDGVALSFLAAEPVEVTTETPTGEPIEVRTRPDGEVEATPSDAIISFGIAADVEEPADGSPDPEDTYAAVCPYVKAFRSREGYEGWAAAVDAATVGLPLEAGVPIARELIEGA